MEELFDNLFANMYDSGFSGQVENPLTHDMIEESVARICDFFHIESPMGIEEGMSTSVNLGNTSTYGDEILFYNCEQLESMGITGQDGLDLVMTHEGTHIALQDLDTGFNSYQEELCCDYMAGVRAGLNGMDVTQLENAFDGLSHDATHPDGSFRIEAIENGVEFAKEYMASHGVAPTFDECLEDFKGEYMQDVAELSHLRNEVYAHECAIEHYQKIVEREPENEDALRHLREGEFQHQKALFEYEHKQTLKEEKYDETSTKGEVSFRGKEKELTSFSKSNVDYHTKKADKCFEEEESCYKRAEQAEHRGDAKLAKDYIQQAKQWHKEAEGHLRSAKAWNG